MNLIESVKKFCNQSYDYVKVNVLEKVTEQQKKITLIALGSLTFLFIAYKLYYWIYPATPQYKGEFDGKMTLKGLKERLDILVTGSDVNFNKDGFTGKQIRLQVVQDIYHGTFNKGCFTNGEFTGKIGGKIFCIQVKNSKFEKVEELQKDLTKCELSEMKCDALQKIAAQADLFFNPSYIERYTSYSFEGSFKGKVAWGRTVRDVALNSFSKDTKEVIKWIGTVDKQTATFENDKRVK